MPKNLPLELTKIEDFVMEDDKFKDLTMMEIGSCQGNSTAVYGNIFKK